MDLQAQFQKEVEQNNWWVSDQPIVVAISTGVDSMVLLNLLQHLTSNRPKIIVAHVNHKLREQSDIEEQYLKNYCTKNNLTFKVKHWEHHEITNGMESQAREFRYKFFADVMRATNSKVLITAHQQNDQAETVLMKLARSGNLREVIGIQRVRDFNDGKLIRPLLPFNREQIEKYARNKKIKWFEDQTNHDDEVQRNRIRHHILPSLIQENSQAVKHLAEFADEIQQQNNLVYQLMQERFANTKSFRESENEILINKSDIGDNLDTDLQFMVSKLSPITLNNPQLNEIKQLIRNQKKPQGTINLGRQLKFEKSYQKLKFKKIKNQNKTFREKCRFMVVLNHWYELSNGNSVAIFDFKNLPKGKYLRQSYFWLSDKQFPLYIRPSQKSDSIRLKGGGNKKLRRILIDHKVPNEERLHVQSLITNDDQILSILGIQESSIKKAEQTNLYVLLVKKESFDERRYPKGTL